MAFDREGFAFPKCDASNCVECGACTKTCPVVLPGMTKPRPGFPLLFAGWATTPEYRRDGSSGGVFAALAAHTIAAGGLVAGARTDGLTVRHDVASTLEEMRGFQGSKYLQSETAGIYRRVLNHLEGGRRVLFSGTPCQVAGMIKLAARRRGQENLSTCEVACMGVPSLAIWRRYVEEAGDDLDEVVSFRDKQEGWESSFAVTLRAGGHGRTVRSTYREGDFFLRAFEGCLIMRNSCYDCPFAAHPRLANVTLADFWGLRQCPAERPKGVSLVVANDQAGLDALHACSDLELSPVSWEEALIANPRVYEGQSLLPWRGFIARRLLGIALRHGSPLLLRRIYGGSIPRWRFWWWPYKVALRWYASAANRRRRALYRVRTEVPLGIRM